jgi:hypothetical protein
MGLDGMAKGGGKNVPATMANCGGGRSEKFRRGRNQLFVGSLATQKSLRLVLRE